MGLEDENLALANQEAPYLTAGKPVPQEITTRRMQLRAQILEVRRSMSVFDGERYQQLRGVRASASLPPRY